MLNTDEMRGTSLDLTAALTRHFSSSCQLVVTMEGGTPRVDCENSAGLPFTDTEMHYAGLIINYAMPINPNSCSDLSVVGWRNTYHNSAVI